MKTTSRLLSFLMSLMMVFTLIPVSVSASYQGDNAGYQTRELFSNNQHASKEAFVNPLEEEYTFCISAWFNAGSIPAEMTVVLTDEEGNRIDEQMEHVGNDDTFTYETSLNWYPTLIQFQLYIMDDETGEEQWPTSSVMPFEFGEDQSFIVDTEEGEITFLVTITGNSPGPEGPVYTITFDANGGTVFTDSMETVSGGTLESLPTAIREGYRLLGWFTDPDEGEEITLDTVFEGDTIVYAHWKQPSYYTGFETEAEVSDWTFVDKDADNNNWMWADNVSAYPAYQGNGVIYSESYRSWEGSFTPDNWAISPVITVPEAGDSAVSFMASGSTDSNYCKEVIAIYVIPVGESSDVPSVDDEGWTKLGSDYTTTDTFKMYGGTLSAYAGENIRIAIRHYNCRNQYEVRVDDFTVENGYRIFFDENYEEAQDRDYAVTLADGTLGELPAPERIGFVFLGWFTDPDEGEEITLDTVFTEDTTVYAHWQEAYTITFDGNEGTVSPEQATVNLNNQLTSLPTAVREGYNFLGWFTDPVEGEEITLDTVFDGDTTVYAHWQEAYTITFDGNEGTVSPKQGTTNINNQLTSLPTAVREGYNFLGWFTDPVEGEEITLDTVFDGDTTVYAHWQEPYIITFDANEGTVSPERATTNKNCQLTSLPTAIRDGYRFLGWFTDLDEGEEITLDTVFEGDTTVYAHWTQSSYNTGFETEAEVSDWTFVDKNGDSNNWMWADNVSAYPAYQGNGVIYSQSYKAGEGPLTPDNWAISPVITVPAGDSAVSFMASGRTNENDCKEVIAIYAIPVGESSEVPSVDDEGWTKLGSDYTTTDTFKMYGGTLSAYAGKNIRIAIRHYNCNDQNEVRVDAFTVENGYRVSFNENFEEAQDPDYAVTLADGKLVELPVPERTGYRFLGWFTDPDEGKRITLDTVFDGDTIVYAHWKQSSYNTGFETEEEVSGWTFVDKDADNNNWMWADDVPDYPAYQGNGVIYSQSYKFGEGSFTPDNWAISPVITVPEAGDSAVSFMASGSTDSRYCKEVIAIYAIPVGESSEVPSVDDEGWTKLGSDHTTTDTFKMYGGTLSAYAGENIRIAIRHYNCNNQYEVRVDGFTVENGYRVSFNENFEEAQDPYYAVTLADGKLGELPVPERIDFVFLGWFTDPDEGEEITLDTVFTEDTTVYAHWGNILYGTSFETDDEFAEWILIDKDEDGRDWVRETVSDSSGYAYEGVGYVRSYSFIDGTALSPDNWLISPAVELLNGDNVVTFFARNYSRYFPDTIGIFVAETLSDLTDPDSWTQIGNDITPDDVYTYYTEKLNAFAGKTVRIAIRHYNSDDNYSIIVDDFQVAGLSRPYSITVNEDVEGGTISADVNKAYYGDTVTLSYKAAENYAFKEWKVTDADGNNVEVSEDNTFVMPNADVIVSASFESLQAPAEPAFVGRSVILEGRIGMYFIMKIPAEYREGSYMTFKVGNGEETTVTFDEAVKSGETYKFICRVTSIEMADKIHAVFHYAGEDQVNTIEDEYTVQNYLAYIVEHAEDPDYEPAVDLAKALHNYGVYAQAALPGGGQHTAMNDCYEGQELISELSDYPVSIALGTAVNNASFSLSLDSETSINFYLDPWSGVTEDMITVFPAREGVDIGFKKTGNQALVSIPDIGAHLLGTEFTLAVSDGTEITASAMSYVQSALQSSDCSEDTKKLAAALYDYYRESMKYIKNQKG